ncbi:YciI family protein [Actinokineospora sp. HUAS TT18]|uniref:YciI family protein n=1 Tax=Actinokineospora sp. HUAS TT18 TaxID=3447451 RepID=UPI002D03602D|nr:YciI family protein [Actinokineospora sp.]
MAQYAILLYSPAPADPMDITPEEIDAQVAFGKELESRGVEIVNPQALQPSTTATAIRGGAITDGPFVESKEVLAGFFQIEAPDLDAALEIAKLVPTSPGGGVEVRPIFEPPAE